MEAELLVLVVLMVILASALVWLSLIMAATEGAVSRVTRASLNNLILEVQTDLDLGQFSRMKRIEKIHRVQRLISDRYATAGSCAFFRIVCNVLDGALVVAIVSLFHLPLWIGVLCGLVFALIVAFVSILVRPRVAGASKPLDIMLAYARITAVATRLTPFAKAR
ncbi:MAG: HlyC/CorC family transporter, partial [Bifidobacterium crudilactis]|nr:HlyC/CorC family transporter [Bifidobacterium crudilactis]